ncbi:ribonuclease D [Pedosphaera parvula]|uniref:ribonuclease D n=1 Tax=Pedosphaera parvula TaxID=1032527 RepID=UPI00058FBF1E|nr:ribonuclease D [Pedosphaera parvula]
MIDSDVTLKNLLGRLSSTPWVALDTEADSLHAYPEKVCLLQITTPLGDELIDPLSGINLDPLLDTFGGHELIMHGSDYDLRLLRKHHAFVPKAIFDTMLASRLLGHTQFGLVHLVAHYLGVTLEKGSQKADWAKRPLTPRMEAYARNDTHYLKHLADRLKSDLEVKGRLGWHQELCARLIIECSQNPEPDPDLVWRIKGSNRLYRPALAVLREVWRWREAEAIVANRPPYFVLRHETLIDLSAAAASGHPVQPLLPQKFSDRRRATLSEAIKRGLSVPHEQQPEPLRHEARRLSEADRRRVEELQKRRDARATELGIDPTLIASRATLLDLAEDWDRHAPDLMNWQRELMTQAASV